jgi:NADH-quinone oxidoreductase subunit M
MIYEKTHSREIADYGGLAKVAPIFTIAFLLVTFYSIAVALTNGFVGEFLILLGAFQNNPIFSGFAVLGVILGAVYMLWAVKRIFFGGPGKLITEHHGESLDIGVREILVLAPLLVLIFWMGIFPSDFLNWSKASLDNLIQNRAHYELHIEE